MDNDQTIDNLKITKKKRESGQLERPAEPAGKFTREVKLDTNESVAAEKDTREPGTNPSELAESSVAQRSYRPELEAQAEEAAEAEEYYVDQLNDAREESLALNSDLDSLRQKISDFHRPSTVKWAVILTLGIVNDLIDILTLTGFLEVLVWVISLILTASILLIIWLMDGRVKKANGFLAELGEPEIEQQGRAGLKQEIKMKWKGGRQYLGTKRTAVRAKSKNPITKTLFGSVVESVPFIGSINLVSVWILFSYFDEVKIFKQARKKAEEEYNRLLTSE